jgi:hypothetical protein
MNKPNMHARAPWRVEAPLAPIEGESLDGFIARVAAANWIENALTITSLAGVIYGHKPTLSTSNWEGLPILADCLQTDLEQLQRRSYPTVSDGRRVFLGIPMARNDIDIAVRRFSPSALAISPHHRALWQLRAFPFCAETWQFLADRCPRCNAFQRWHHTNGIARCDRCVEDLSAAQVMEVPSTLRPSLKAALGLVHHDPSCRLKSLAMLPSALGDLGNADAYDLLVRVAIVVEPRLTPARFGTNARWNQPAPIVAAAIAAAWDILLGWPCSMEHLMADRLSVATKRHRDGNDGATMRFLRVPTKIERVQAKVRTIIEQFRDAIDLDGQNSSWLHQATLSTHEASVRLGHSTGGVAELRRQGALRTVFALHECRATPRYDADEIDGLAGIIEKRISLEGAASKLGIPVYGLEQLLALGLLETEGDRFCVPRYGSPQLTRPKLDEFISAIRHSSTETLASQPVTLRAAAVSIGGRLKPWGPIFASLMTGSLPFVIETSGSVLAEQILVDHTCYRFLRSLRFKTLDYPRARFSSTMSRRDAGEALNLHPRAYTEVLKALDSNAAGEKAVSVLAVEKLCKAHITSRELALRLGTSTKGAIAEAKEMRVPLLGPAGWCRDASEARLGLI